MTSQKVSKQEGENVATATKKVWLGLISEQSRRAVLTKPHRRSRCLTTNKGSIAYRKTSCWPSQDAVTVESFPASIVTCLVALFIGFCADA